MRGPRYDDHIAATLGRLARQHTAKGLATRDREVHSRLARKRLARTAQLVLRELAHHAVPVGRAEVAAAALVAALDECHCDHRHASARRAGELGGLRERPIAVRRAAVEHEDMRDRAHRHGSLTPDGVKTIQVSRALRHAANFAGVTAGHITTRDPPVAPHPAVALRGW